MNQNWKCRPPNSWKSLSYAFSRDHLPCRKCSGYSGWLLIIVPMKNFEQMLNFSTKKHPKLNPGSSVGDNIALMTTLRWWQHCVGDLMMVKILSDVGCGIIIVTNIDVAEKREHPSWDPKWFGFIKVAYLAIPISNGLNSTHSWYRIADSFGFTTTAVNIGIGCLKSVKRFWNSDNLIGGFWIFQIFKSIS